MKKQTAVRVSRMRTAPLVLVAMIAAALVAVSVTGASGNPWKKNPATSDPPDKTPYYRETVPHDYPMAPSSALPQAFPPVFLRDTVVSNTDTTLNNTDIQNDGECSIAINPENPDEIVISAFSGGWGANSVIWYSSDGGGTWTREFSIPAPPGVPAALGCPCDQAFDYGRGGLLSGTFLVGSSASNNANIISGTTSDPTSSASWNWLLSSGVAQFTNSAGLNNADQPWLLVNRDPSNPAQDNVYVAYDDFTVSPRDMRVAVSLGVNPPNFTRDASAGSGPTGGINPGLRLAVDPRTGWVYAAFQQLAGNANDDPKRVRYMLNRSTDGGVTWGLNGNPGGIVIATEDSTQPTPKFGTVNALLGGVDHVAVDPRNSDVYYVYGNRDSSTGNNRLSIVRLSDNGGGGLNMAAPVFVTGQVQAAIPQVAVTTSGVVGVFYYTYDGMSGGFPQFTAHLGLSTDQGATFSDTVLMTFLSSATDDGNARQRVLGDYQQMKAVGCTFYGAFTANGVQFGRPFANHDPIFFKLFAGALRICKFDDQNLNGVADAGEEVEGWPFHVEGPGTSVDVVTGSDGCVEVCGGGPGTYTITESVTLEANGSTFNDPRPGETKRWRIETPIEQKVTIDATGATVDFFNVSLGSILVCKFNDADMSGTVNGSETGIADWPVRLAGTKANGAAVGPIDLMTGPDGCVRFADLDPGAYTVSEEGGGILWEKVQTDCGGTQYCDWRTSYQNRRWQATNPTPGADCSTAGAAPAISGIAVAGSDEAVDLGDVCLTTVTAFKFHDLNMTGAYEPAGEAFTDTDGNSVWTAAEPFTDINCNKQWDSGEYFADLNSNNVWDPAEQFTDTDGDKVYDWPECPIEGWPFALSGTRADSKPVCLKGSTGADGLVTFYDIAPSSPGGYTLKEELAWCSVALPTGVVQRATFYAPSNCNGPSLCSVNRWQATTPTEVTVMPPYCQPTPQLDFGNIGLARVDGVKEVYDDGMPGDVPPKPGAGWKIDLAGTDVLGNDVVPSGAPCTLLPQAAVPPIDIPCLTPKWYETVTAADGSFSFVDLLPGHYHLMEQALPGYRLVMDRPLLCGFDVMVCPQTVRLTNIKQGLASKVYQVYPSTSNGQVLCDVGLAGQGGDVISAVPGVLCIDPGNGWSNFTQAAQLCRESLIKNVTLTKTLPGIGQCSDIYATGPNYPGFSQHGSRSIRLWWPLMYDPPGTTWTLKVSYGTKTPVKLPGETVAGYIHTDEWNWVIDTDLDRMKLYLDLLHQTEFGLSEVPLISDEEVYGELQGLLDEVKVAVQNGNNVVAADKLIEFEFLLMDNCVYAAPDFGAFSGPAAGIAQTLENPACCKLMVDAEYLARKLGIYVPAK